MNDTVKLTYELNQPSSWGELVELKIPLADLPEYSQITKVLVAMITFFTKIGYDIDAIAEGYSDIADQLLESLGI